MGALQDKVAIVTGAGRGIGRAIAIAFANEGVKVVCSARSTEEIDVVAKEAGGIAVTCDVGQQDDIEALMQKTIGMYGRIDILVNNAGAVARLPTHELPVEE